MRAIVYARYSSDLQRDASIEDQIRLCRARIEHEGWGYLHAYTDRAISGSSTLRPAYQRLLEDARRGQFDIVVSEALDRLSRDQEDVAGLFKRLRFADIRLFTLAEGEITELHVGLKGTMNALFLRDLAQKTRRGLEGRVREGRSGGGLCFGYVVVREFDSRGDPIHGGRRTNQEEAAVVCRIFSEFAAGKSPRRIAFDLNRVGIPGPRGGEWSQSTINGNAARGTGILNNELYVGRLVWNRLRYVKDPTTGKRISRMNERERWVVRHVPELQIISEALWDRVKRRQKTLKRDTRPDAGEKPFWGRQRPRHLITGLGKCGECGSSYVKINANMFGCAAARNRGTCSNRLNIRLDTLETMILDGLRSRLMEPELFKVFCDEFHREVNRLRMDRCAALETQRAELDRVERRIRRIVELITEDDAPVRSMKQELVSLETRQHFLEQQLAVSHAPAPLIHPALAEIYRKRVERLHEALHDPASRDEALEAVRSLIGEIRFVPEDGRLRIELRGELAGMLALAADSKKLGGLSAAELSEQIKMVAGVRNRILANFAAIKAAPEGFLLLMIIAIGVSYLAFQRVEREHLAVLETKIAEREALITEYRSKLNGATPDQAANEIEKLTKTLADAQRNLNEAKTKAASFDVRPRDPRSLYEEDNPIALVRDPKIDLDNKKITFPAVTSSVILGINKSYQFQNWKLACGSTQVYNAIRNGAAREFSYAPLTCKIVGNR